MRCVLLFAACVGPGCLHRPAEPGRPPPTPQVSIVPNGTEVHIRDRRPDDRPARGVEPVDLGTLAADPWDAARAAVEAAADAGPMRPERVEVDVYEFRASLFRVVDRSSDTQAPCPPGPTEVTEVGFWPLFVGVFGSPLDGLVHVAGDFFGRLVTGSVELARAPAGASCVIDTHVRVHWPGGRVTEGRVTGRGVRSLGRQGGDRREGLNDAARQAVAEFGRSVHALVAAGPAD